MRSFSEGFRSFKKGLSKRLIWAYWLAIREHAWEILWGAGPFGILFTIITVYYSPSKKAWGWVVAWCFFVAGYYAWRQAQLEIERLKDNVSLEIRPSPGETLNSSSERAYSHYRMEIYNPTREKAHHVQVKLVGIEPLPMSEFFLARADFPYHVRLAHVADGPVDGSTDHDINPRTSEQFELLFSWESSDERTMVDGIDTKQALSRDARFSIEDKECWHLKYEVSSAKDDVQRPIFTVRREGKSLSMSRLV
jgi:hypothetical protein